MILETKMQAISQIAFKKIKKWKWIILDLYKVRGI